MSDVALESALVAAGWHCRVEARERLAIIIPSGDHALAATVLLRDAALRLSREHGFTHVAVEIPAPPEADALVPGD